MSENAGSGRNDSFGGGSDNPWDDRALDDQVGPGEAEPQADNTQWAESATPASVTAVRRPLRRPAPGIRRRLVDNGRFRQRSPVAERIHRSRRSVAGDG
ncbi:hypothetical protein GCM10020255_019710 [Rhodococcus baikonurensis]